MYTTRRLLPHAVNVSGWSHLWANVLQKGMHQCSRFPSVLEHIRALLRFFRNSTYKMFLKRHRDIPIDMKSLLNARCPTVAKWRFETLHDALTYLFHRRVLCQVYLSTDMFSSVQDVSLYKKCLDACRWDDFWSLISANLVYMCKPIEENRRWGLVCNCCANVRLLHKKALCQESSKRLKQASEFIRIKKAALYASLNVIDAVACEGVQWVYESLVLSVTASAFRVGLKFDFVHQLPYVLSHIDSQEGCVFVMEKIDVIGVDTLDDVTAHYITPILHCVQQGAAIGFISECCRSVATKFQNIPMSEFAEGYHRQTHLSLIRSPASKTPWMLA